MRPWPGLLSLISDPSFTRAYSRMIYFRSCAVARTQSRLLDLSLNVERCIYYSRVNMKAVRTDRSSRCSILPFSFLISLFILHAQPLALNPPPLSLTTPTNLTDVRSYHHCVSDPTWNPWNLEIAPSCEDAVVALSDDISIWGFHPGTFVYRPGARSTASFPGGRSSLPIPKRYVSGPCVVAIVMMKMFERSSIGQFPGLPDSVIGKWRSRDTSTWKALIQPAEYVRATCDNGCGYAVLGRDLGIGVAIWGTGSKWDRYARGIGSLSEGDEVMPVLEIANPSVVGVGNESVVEALR